MADKEPSLLEYAIVLMFTALIVVPLGLFMKLFREKNEKSS